MILFIGFSGSSEFGTPIKGFHRPGEMRTAAVVKPNALTVLLEGHLTGARVLLFYCAPDRWHHRRAA